MNITDLPGAIGTILGQEKLLKITLIRGRGESIVAQCKAKVMNLT